MLRNVTPLEFLDKKYSKLHHSLIQNYKTEGAVGWSATGLEHQGICMDRGSTPPPSADFR